MEYVNLKKLFLHLSGWVLVFIFFFWMFWGERQQSDTLSFAITITTICIAVFYSHSYLTTLINKRKWFWYISGVVLLLVSGPLFLTLGLNKFAWDFPSYLFLPFFLLTVVFIIFSWLNRFTEIWVFNILKRKDLEKQKVSAELAFLKSQINPHFLFNTLNNIHTLAYKQSPHTPEAIMQLSSMMRYMIYESNAGQVDLGREIEYLEDYIKLQQLRSKNSAIVDFQITGNIDSFKIAPLLLIPLLENAFKHSSFDSNTVPIKMSLRVEKNELLFFISNPVANNIKNNINDEGGIGIENLKKRLRLLYPGRHKFEVRAEEGLFSVNLNIRDLNNYDEKSADMHSYR